MLANQDGFVEVTLETEEVLLCEIYPSSKMLTTERQIP